MAASAASKEYRMRKFGRSTGEVSVWWTAIYGLRGGRMAILQYGRAQTDTGFAGIVEAYDVRQKENPMNKYLIAYAGTAVAMVALDMLWLGLIAKPLYQQGIGHLMADKINVPVAVLFYALYAVGLVIFAVSPHTGGYGWGKTATMAALFGFFAYATYDLTNLSTLKGWPLGLSLIDIAWGMFVSTAAACAGKASLDWMGNT